MPETDPGAGLAAEQDAGIADRGEGITQEEGGGQAGETWLSSLPDELRENPSLTKFKEPVEVYRSYVSLEKKIGEKGIIKPKDDAPPEEWNKYYVALGRPETPDSYEIGRPEGLPDEFPYSEELEGQFKQWAHEAGLTAKQAKGLFDKYIQANIGAYDKASKEIGEARGKAEQVLRSEWGDNYDTNLELALKARRQFAPDQGPEWEQLEFGLGNNPTLVKMFANIGARMSEGELIKGTPQPGTMTEEQALEAMSTNPAYMNADHPEHLSLRRKVNLAFGVDESQVK